MKIKHSAKIEILLNRAIKKIIVRKDLEKMLRSGRKLRVKFGIDPTSSELHLGHLVVLRKLKQLQELGHKIIFIIGDFTAMIGDPSGRTSSRRPLTREQIQKNMVSYIKQVSKILDIKKTEVKYNSQWYKKKRFDFFLELASCSTYSRLTEREEFRSRLKAGLKISVPELIYPLLQGYDSVEVRADVEIGGADQELNLLMGREVQKNYGQPEQNIITIPLLEGIDGKRKMSKTFGNYINLFYKTPLNESEMFGKIMSIPDNLIWKYFDLLTDVSLEEIIELKKETKKNSSSFKEAKLKLAQEIVGFCHNKKTAQRAVSEFERIFSQGKFPEKVEILKLSPCSIEPKKLLLKGKLVSSLSEAQRLIEQGAVSLNSEVIKDWRQKLEIKKPIFIKVGKHRFLKVELILKWNLS